MLMLGERYDAATLLELGVGTGRLAIPLAAAGLAVIGVDVSPAMLARLAEADPTGTVGAVVGDMVEDLPDGPTFPFRRLITTEARGKKLVIRTENSDHRLEHR